MFKVSKAVFSSVVASFCWIGVLMQQLLEIVMEYT